MIMNVLPLLLHCLRPYVGPRLTKLCRNKAVLAPRNREHTRPGECSQADKQSHTQSRPSLVAALLLSGRGSGHRAPAPHTYRSWGWIWGLVLSVTTAAVAWPLHRTGTRSWLQLLSTAER